MCHMSCVTCQVSGVTCHVSGIPCQLLNVIFFVGQSGVAWQWRVCYQRGLPCLVFLNLLNTIPIQLSFVQLPPFFSSCPDHLLLKLALPSSEPGPLSSLQYSWQPSTQAGNWLNIFNTYYHCFQAFLDTQRRAGVQRGEVSRLVFDSCSNLGFEKELYMKLLDFVEFAVQAALHS